MKPPTPKVERAGKVKATNGQCSSLWEHEGPLRKLASCSGTREPSLQLGKGHWWAWEPCGQEGLTSCPLPMPTLDFPAFILSPQLG